MLKQQLGVTFDFCHIYRIDSYIQFLSLFVLTPDRIREYINKTQN